MVAVIAVAMGATYAASQHSAEDSAAGIAAEGRHSITSTVEPAAIGTPTPSKQSASVSASPSASPSKTVTASAPPSASAKAKAPEPAPDEPERTRAAPAAGTPFKTGYDGSLDAQAAVDAALRSAEADGKAVLLDFGANWCGNCKAADEVFAAGDTAGILGDSYHVVKVDIGSSGSDNFSLLREYSPGGGSYKMPVLIVLSPSGTVLTDTQETGKPDLTADGLNAWLRKWA
ncbi:MULTISPECIES: thioredoxin family protein [unclassified Streptomyces]|uniref:thioredoxin family protein n=1 Tax=unclassified Streptomyces TaxID=2593676 RepID=UPI00386CBB05|nr:thioredoxin family protein [Streptomyces sp. NBC_01017]WSV34884.1 thioredoxin family protein [Streptomyces sp. NBC_01017]